MARAQAIGTFTGYNVQDTIVIVPSDAVTIAADSTRNPRAYRYCHLTVLVAGNAAVKDINGNTLTFTALPVGIVIAFPVSQVLATGTTASLHGLVCKGETN